jgi:hypothetical protein
MDQPLSVALMPESFLARPWLPPRAFIVFGAAAFSSGLALRARTKGCSVALFERDGQSGFDERWHRHAGKASLCDATPSVMPFVGTQCKTDE